MRSCSVIIPVYQSFKTLERCLVSISSNFDRESDLEVIAVFDGHDQECIEIWKNWQSKSKVQSKFEVIDKSGVVVARNRGVEISRGENIAFLDADDEITSNRLHWLQTDLRGTLIIGKQEIIQLEGLNYVSSILHPSDYHLMSFVINRFDFLKLGGFAIEFSVGSEWDLTIRATEYGLKINKIDEIFLRRHIHTENYSHGNKLVKIEHIKAVREHINRFRLN